MQTEEKRAASPVLALQPNHAVRLIFGRYCRIEREDLKRNTKSFPNTSIIHTTVKQNNDRNAASLVIASIADEAPNHF